MSVKRNVTVPVGLSPIAASVPLPADRRYRSKQSGGTANDLAARVATAELAERIYTADAAAFAESLAAATTLGDLPNEQS
jgi:hypothetical protein